MSNAAVWTPGSNNIPVADPNSQVRSELFTATEGQTLFTLTTFTYHVNGGALEVFVNGNKAPSNTVSETSESSFTLVDACDVGDIVEAVGNTEMASAEAAAVIASDAATAALASQVAAAASAASALSSKNAATVSETNSAASAVAAAASLTSVNAVYDNFDDRFLGPKAAAPTLDNDGAALAEGAMYWNTTTKAMFVWNGTAWKAVLGNPTPQTLTDAATIAWDWANGNAVVSIGANRTLGNPTNATDGDYRTLRVARTGAFTLTAFGAKFKGVSAISQSAINGYVDHFVFRYHSTSDTFELVGMRSAVQL